MSDEVNALEQEADATRERIAATVDNLQHKLSPRTMMHNAFGQFTDKLGGQGTQLVAGARSIVQDHPVATATAALTLGRHDVRKLAYSRCKDRLR